MAFNPLTYTTSGVVFAKATFENLVNVAQSATGDGVLTDIIEPVTFASGTISLQDANTNVSGVGTLFTTDFRVGQYLFYYDTTGDPILAGRILSISSDTTLTLAEGFQGDDQTGVKCGMTNSVIGGYESFLVRVPVIVNTTNQTCVMPNWVKYMLNWTLNLGGFNDSNTINLEQYSAVNNPQNPASPPLTNIPLFISPYGYWQYTISSSGNEGNSGQRLYFPSVNDFPKYVFALLNPYGESNEQRMPVNTLCRFFFNENFTLNGVSFGLNTPSQDILKAGYNLFN